MVRRRSKKKPEIEATESLTDNSETYISKSANTAIVKGGRGHKIIQHFHAEEKPIQVPSYTQNESELIGLGRWIMLHLFGSLNPDLGLFTIILYLAGIVSGGVTFSPFVPNSPFTVGSQYFVPVELAGILALLVVLVFFRIIQVSKETRCPKCGWRFSRLIEKKILKKTRNLAEKKVREYQTTYTCNNPSCDYKKVETEPEEISTEVESDSDLNSET
jgi:hypothetical protein